MFSFNRSTSFSFRSLFFYNVGFLVGLVLFQSQALAYIYYPSFVTNVSRIGFIGSTQTRRVEFYSFDPVSTSPSLSSAGLPYNLVSLGLNSLPSSGLEYYGIKNTNSNMCVLSRSVIDKLISVYDLKFPGRGDNDKFFFRMNPKNSDNTFTNYCTLIVWPHFFNNEFSCYLVYYLPGYFGLFKPDTNVVENDYNFSLVSGATSYYSVNEFSVSVTFSINFKCSITGYFGDNGTQAVNFIDRNTKFPFSSDLESTYSLMNRAFDVNYNGLVQDYSLLYPGTIEEYFETVKRALSVDVVNNSSPIFNCWGSFSSGGDSGVLRRYNYRTFDYDQGTEPDAHEFVSRHNINDPSDDWAGASGVVVDIGDKTQVFIEDSLRSQLLSLDTLIKGPGVDVITAPTDSVTDPISSDGSDPNNENLDFEFQDPEYLPEFAEFESVSGLTDEIFNTYVGADGEGLEEAFKGVAESTTENDLPSFSVDVLDEEVEIDFNSIFDDSEITGFFDLFKTFVIMALWVAVIIFVIRDFSNSIFSD